jgi:hypothetical protein
MGGIGTSVTTYRLVIHDATRRSENRDENKKESRTKIRTKAQSTLLGAEAEGRVDESQARSSRGQTIRQVRGESRGCSSQGMRGLMGRVK